MGEGEESWAHCYKTQRLFPHIEGSVQHLWRDLFQSCQPCVQTVYSPPEECVFVFLKYIETREGKPLTVRRAAPWKNSSSSLSGWLPAILGEDFLILLSTSWISWEDFTLLNISQ